MPIPPATKTYAGAGTSGKRLRGPRTSTVMPVRSSSCTSREPPRPSGTSRVATRQGKPVAEQLLEEPVDLRGVRRRVQPRLPQVRAAPRRGPAECVASCPMNPMTSARSRSSRM